MAIVTTPATILKTYAYSETSKILRLLTRDRGLCSVIAKGALRPKSRFGGMLEPFTDGVATYYARVGKDLHTLSAFELSRERQSLGRQLVRFAGAGLVTEIALRFASPAADERLFAQLRQALDRMVVESGDLEAAILEEVWQLVTCLGFAPSIESCGSCGNPVPAGADSYFDLAEGVLVCQDCRRILARSALRELPSRGREELIALLHGRPENGRLRTSRLQRSLLRDFIAFHLDGRPLNSFRFLDDRLG